MSPDDRNVLGWNDIGTAPAKLNKETMKLIGRSFKVLGTCIKEAPEFGNRKRFKKEGQPQGLPLLGEK